MMKLLISTIFLFSLQAQALTGAEKTFGPVQGKYQVISYECFENEEVNTQACNLKNPKRVEIRLRGEDACYKLVAEAGTETSRCLTEFDVGNGEGYRYNSYFETEFGEHRHIVEFNTKTMRTSEIFVFKTNSKKPEEFEIYIVYKKITYDDAGNELARFSAKEVFRVIQ